MDQETLGKVITKIEELGYTVDKRDDDCYTVSRELDGDVQRFSAHLWGGTVSYISGKPINKYEVYFTGHTPPAHTGYNNLWATSMDQALQSILGFLVARAL